MKTILLLLLLLLDYAEAESVRYSKGSKNRKRPPKPIDPRELMGLVIKPNLSDPNYFLASGNHTSDGEEGFERKTVAILIFLVAGLVIGLMINFANLNTDFLDIREFYRGYMGRKMLLSEGILTSREYLMELWQKESKHDSHGQPKRGKKVRMSVQLVDERRGSVQSPCNGRVAIARLTAIEESASISDLQLPQFIGQSQQQHQQPKVVRSASEYKLNPRSSSSHFTPRRVSEGHLHHKQSQPERQQQQQPHLPPPPPHDPTKFIDDHDPEWSHLDYSIEIAEPPTNYCEFVMLYDWWLYIFFNNLNKEDMVRRRNLYYQFRKWKKRRRRLYHIVVTQRAKREMADADDSMGGGRK